MSARFGNGVRLWVSTAVLLSVLASGGEAWAQTESRPVLLLLPVRVHSSENPTYLREGLTDMLQARFRQGGVFELKQITDPSRSTTNLAEAVAIAREEGADFVLFGSFTRFGAGASLDMQAATTSLTSADDSMREIFVHSGSIAEVIPDLDELVGKVTQFAGSESAASAPEVGDRTVAAGYPSRAEFQALRQRVEALEAGRGGATVLPASP